jgi:hypothetical protein
MEGGFGFRLRPTADKSLSRPTICRRATASNASWRSWLCGARAERLPRRLLLPCRGRRNELSFGPGAGGWSSACMKASCRSASSANSRRSSTTSIARRRPFVSVAEGRATGAMVAALYFFKMKKGIATSAMVSSAASVSYVARMSAATSGSCLGPTRRPRSRGLLAAIYMQANTCA